MDGSDQQTRFIQSRSSASIPHGLEYSFRTIVRSSYGQVGGCCVGFCSITHLFLMLLVSVEEIGR